MSELRFAIIGTGFWARYQLAAWRELAGVALRRALQSHARPRPRSSRRSSASPAVYDDAEELLAREKLDFIDIITDVDTHAPLVELAAKHKVPVICQKPMAPTLALAEADGRRRASPPACRFAIHENWRWQTPIRELKTRA